MIRIRELRKTGEGVDARVHISYFIRVEDQTIYQEVIVDDFDIEGSTIEQVEALIESNAHVDAIMSIYKARKKQLSSTYRHDGQAFKRNLVLTDWEVGTTYQVNDIVEFEDMLYRCVQAHTATDPTWTPVATAALWSPILVFADEYQTWKQPQGAHDAYPMGAIVTHVGVLYTSDVEANVWEPPEQWSVYDPNAPVVPPGPNDWEPETIYTSGDLVVYEAETYIALIDHTSMIGQTPDISPTEWGVYSGGSDIPLWSGEGVEYAISDEVTYEGIIYICIQVHTSQPGWDPVSVPSLWSPL